MPIECPKFDKASGKCKMRAQFRAYLSRLKNNQLCENPQLPNNYTDDCVNTAAYANAHLHDNAAIINELDGYGSA